jgi:hypothetical protein
LVLEEEAEEADTDGEGWAEAEEEWAEAGEEWASWPRIASAPVAARFCLIAWESPAFRPPAPTALLP